MLANQTKWMSNKIPCVITFSSSFFPVIDIVVGELLSEAGIWPGAQRHCICLSKTRHTQIRKNTILHSIALFHIFTCRMTHNGIVFVAMPVYG